MIAVELHTRIVWRIHVFLCLVWPVVQAETLSIVAKLVTLPVVHIVLVRSHLVWSLVEILPTWLLHVSLLLPVVILKLLIVRQARVLITSDQTIVHRLEACALPLQAGQGHQLPLLDKEVAAVLAHLADVL